MKTILKTSSILIMSIALVGCFNHSVNSPKQDTPLDVRYVQVAAFNSKDRADNLAKAAEKKFNRNIIVTKPITMNGQQFYRVLIPIEKNSERAGLSTLKKESAVFPDEVLAFAKEQDLDQPIRVLSTKD